LLSDETEVERDPDAAGLEIREDWAMRLLILALSVLGILVSADAAQADRRVAFVVGNGAYKHVTPLPNPPIDATSMAGLLRNAGFDVVEGINLTRDKMTERLLEFGKKTQGADVAVFFYAGHGIAVDGINYLLPVDADIKSEIDNKLGNAINVDLTLDQTMNAAKVKLVFLDACRDTPFAAGIKAAAGARSVSVQTGLVEMKSSEGTLIAFAAGPGQTALDGEAGTNSPFTRALLAHITQPAVEIQQAMTQVRGEVYEQTKRAQLPWGYTNLIGAVYLNPAAAPAAAVAKNPQGYTASAASEVELEFWRSIKDSNRAGELSAYLTSYPNGQFKSIALARIASLENGPGTTTRNLSKPVDPVMIFTEEATQETEDQIGLNKARRKDVQRRLTGLGFDTKANGKFDETTRAVITRWQGARGYPQTGFLNTLQHKALLTETVPTARANSSASGESAEAPPRRRRGGGARHQRGVGGPVGLIGGVVGGLFGRR
jgi:hypothetical protein